MAKPKGLGPEYGAQFQDRSVAEAYAARPPYPPELFAILRGLADGATPHAFEDGGLSGDCERALGGGTRGIGQGLPAGGATRTPNLGGRTGDAADRAAGGEPPWVLDLGCGTGDISRGLAASGMRVDAVDPSQAMIARGQALAGGDQPDIRWIVSTAEAFAMRGPYALAVAARACTGWSGRWCCRALGARLRRAGGWRS